ncbi:hypothetical protein Fmac_008551 [Flemingia macrophylla]|uniref:Uncharacterized protein n=1 Tax=Flemingia macrophylla TaxID=520843 RepID=A0ABD1MXR0_9FABA
MKITKKGTLSSISRAGHSPPPVLLPDCSVARAVLLLLLYHFFDCGLVAVLLSWCSSCHFPFLRHIRKPNPSPPNPNTIICQLEIGHLPPFFPASQGPFISLSNFGSKHRWEDICAFRAFPYKFQTSL